MLAVAEILGYGKNPRIKERMLSPMLPHHFISLPLETLFERARLISVTLWYIYLQALYVPSIVLTHFISFPRGAKQF